MSPRQIGDAFSDLFCYNFFVSKREEMQLRKLLLRNARPVVLWGKNL